MNAPCIEKQQIGERASGAADEKPMLAALGDVHAHGDEMLVAYSVLNTTDHWIEVLPP